MSVIEKMAEAMWNYANDGGWELRPHDGPTNTEREHYREKVRVAMRALAEADLGDDLIIEAEDHAEAFKIIISAIAEGK